MSRNCTSEQQGAASVPKWLERRERELTKRLNNLAMVLSEEEGNEEVPDIPDDAAETWTEEMVREYYRNGGKLPEEQLEEVEAESSVEWQLQQVKALSQVVPGGTIEENLHKRQASTRIDNVSDLKDAEVIEPGYYREACVTDGIPFRQNGLFPPGDKTLIMLSSNKQLKAFEKHLIDDDDERMILTQSSWAAGNSAAENGLDLRCFIDTSIPEDTVGAKLVAAVRFGDGASIGNGISAHGGAIETALDEATAELAKATQGVMCYTTTANFQLKQKVDLHQTYLIEAEITKIGIRGLRISIEASLKDKDGNTAALCSVQLANMAKVRR